MKRILASLGTTALCWLLLTFNTHATTHYVDANGTNPVSPYTDWSTAATNIQDAVTAANADDLILVTNGIYQYGGIITPDGGTNIVVVTNAMTVQSVNGSATTTINGGNRMRNVYLANGASLIGFTVTNGNASSGGGIYFGSAGCLASNCVVVGNSGSGIHSFIAYPLILSSSLVANCIIKGNAPYGLYTGLADNCLLTGNGGAGAAYLSTLYSCTVVKNSSTGLGALDGCTAVNSIIYYNNTGFYADCYQCRLTNCCTTLGNGNGALSNGSISNSPAFVNLAGGDYHLSPVSRCINAGNNAYVPVSTDLDGNPRIVNGTVDMGCYERPYNKYAHCVSITSTNPVFPFNDWSTAATNIQDAIDAANAGDLVLVTNGVYQIGGRKVGSADITNRVVLTNSVIVQSVNGPGVTLIVGMHIPGTVASSSAVRCAFVGSGSVLSGFTITNGEAGIGNYVNGGGVSGSTSGMVSNCVITGNICGGAGGGVYDVSVANSLLAGNLGVGAAAGSAVQNCIVTNNTGPWAAGLYGCKATNCLVAFNSANNYGGGTAFSTLVCCTVTANSLAPANNGNGGGSYNDTLYDCIVYNNSAPNGSNYYSSGMTFSCSAPLPGGSGNISNPPIFANPAAGDFHLQPNSRCINAGNNAYISSTNDLAGNSRVMGGTVDMGAYEFQAQVTGTFDAWLQQYGLPTDGSVDHADLDGTGFTIYQDWIADLNPTNPASVLAMQIPVATNNDSGITVTWQSVNTRTYCLQRSSDLSQPFSAIQSNLVGQADTTSYTDTSATNTGPYFYRVCVQQ